MATLKDALSPFSTFFIISGISFPEQFKSKWYLQIIKVVFLIVSLLFLFTIPLGAVIICLLFRSETIDDDSYQYLIIFLQFWGHLLNLYLLHKHKHGLQRLFGVTQLLTFPLVAINKARQSCKKAIILLILLYVIFGEITIGIFIYSLRESEPLGVLVVLFDAIFFLVMYTWSCILCFIVVLQSFTEDRFHYCVQEIKNSKSPMRRCKLLNRLCHDEIRFQKMFNELSGIFSPILVVVSIASIIAVGFQVSFCFISNSDLVSKFWYHKYTTTSYYLLYIVLLIFKGNIDLNRKVLISYLWVVFLTSSAAYRNAFIYL